MKVAIAKQCYNVNSTEYPYIILKSLIAVADVLSKWKKYIIVLCVRSIVLFAIHLGASSHYLILGWSGILRIFL